MAIGLLGNGWLVEVFASEDGRSWTILVSRPSGISCVMGSGQDWQTMPWQADPGRPL